MKYHFHKFTKHLSRLAVLFCLITASGTVKAQSYDNYRSLLEDNSVKISQTNLPIVFINVDGKMILKDNYILAKMKIIHNGDGNLNYGDTIAHPGQTVNYEGWIALRYRGNTSFSGSNKKPYAFKTLKTNVLPDDGGEKDKVKLLGMGKDNKWAMLAPWCDRSMIRDVLSFELGRPWFDFTPHTRFCEVILDGTYYGVYILTERVSKGKQRLDLHDPGEDEGDLTGDYHVQIDRSDDPYYESKYHPWTDFDGSVDYWKTIKYQYKDPEDDEWADFPKGAKEALHREIDKMEDAFASDDYTNAETGYRKYIDVNSFIDYMLSTEVAMNIDGYRLSTNLYKHSETRAKNEGIDPRWKMSLWDFNIAWGNANYFNGDRTNVWHYTFNQREHNDPEQLPFYWYKLLNDTTYVNQMKQRWADYRQSNYSDEQLYATIDSLTTLLTSGGAVDRNQRAWRIIGRWGVWPSPYTADSYEEEIAYLKSWIGKRLSFMDKALLPKESFSYDIVEIKNGFNADLIAEDRPTEERTSDGVDGNYVFYSESFQADGGLASDRTINSDGSDAIYRLQPYDANNALLLQQSTAEGTLTLASPISTKEVCVLATSANGSSDVDVVINYDDGSKSNEQSLNIPDWYCTSPDGSEGISGLGRIERGSRRVASGYDFALYEFPLPANEKKNVASVTFKFKSWGGTRASIYALSAAKQSSAVKEITTRQTSDSSLEPAIYSLDGTRLGSLQRGINIVRQADGTVKKIVVR